MPENSTIVLAEGLTKHFGETQALRGLDLSLQQGHILGVLGPNGAGKTTAVRILTTLTKPDSGRAEVAGFDVLRQPHEVRLRIGVTGQYAAVDDLLTGRENLEMIGRLSRMSKQGARLRAIELLERLDLADAANRVVRGYSGGMRRRLDLAASLMANPPIIFLDEPTTGLDPRSRMQMWDLIQNLVDNGTSILLTTQYLEEADRLADDIIIINHGLGIARGTATQLKASVGGEQLEVQVAEGNDLMRAAGVLEQFGTGKVHIDETNRRAGVAAASHDGVLSRVVLELDRHGVALSDVAIRRPTLDDVFLKLTGHSLEELEDEEQVDGTSDAERETRELVGASNGRHA
jgi:ABC-2 type transport system ATP-binding protein